MGQLSGGRSPHRPWASFAPSARAEPRQIATLALTVANLQEERLEVVLETALAPRVTGGRVLSVTREHERVEIAAEADGAAVIVVADAFWPGWEARVDGRPVPLMAADVLVRAVPVPGGRHQLVMTYAPQELAIGKALSVVGLVALAIMAWVEWRQRWKEEGRAT